MILHHRSWSIFTQGEMERSLAAAVVIIQSGMREGGKECNPNGQDMGVMWLSVGTQHFGFMGRHTRRAGPPFNHFNTDSSNVSMYNC